MNKKIGLVIGLIVVLVAIIVVVFAINANQVKENDLSALTGEELLGLVNQVYEKSGLEFPMLETTELPLEDVEMLTYHIGLTSTEGVKNVIVSMPMMNAQAYTFALVQTEKGADIEKIKQDIFDHVDPRKWVCVTAEKVMVTNSNSVICLIMSKADQKDALANAFAEVTGNELGNKLEKNGEA